MSEKPYGWIDEAMPSRRRTRRYTNHEVQLVPRFTETLVPVPAEETPCALNPELWFPTPKSPSTRAAKRACSFCWMQPECRSYGLAHPHMPGVWGGLSQIERERRTARH